MKEKYTTKVVLISTGSAALTRRCLSGVEGSGVEGSGVEGSGVEGSGVEGSGVEGSGVEGSGEENIYTSAPMCLS